MTVDMDVDDGPLPDAVATTAYYVVSEAITNAVKHAEATRIVLQVVRRRRPAAGPGDRRRLRRRRLGLRSGLADRVAALGGSLARGQPGRPRAPRCEAALPCAS